MAKFYADASGNILRFVQTPEQEATYGAPTGTVYTLDFDPSTNATTVQAFNADCNSFTMPVGTLTQNGQAVTINAASQNYQTRQLAQQVFAALESGKFQGANVTLSQANAAWTAIQAGTETAAQRDQYLVALGRLCGLVFDRLLSNGTL